MIINSRLIHFIKEYGPDMFDLLEKMVLIQSGSHNKEGVDRVSRLIESSLQSNSVSCRLIEQTKFGNHLIVRSLCEDRFDKQILLVGHMDTVSPKDTDFNLFREDSTKCYGPGVIDMKGGLVAGIFALKALDSLGLLKKIPITFIFNSDEEIGSPSFQMKFGHHKGVGQGRPDIIPNQHFQTIFCRSTGCGGYPGANN